MFTGRQKLAFGRRLRDNWQDLVDYFDIPADQRHSFAPGRKPQGIWEWLAARQRLPEMCQRLQPTLSATVQAFIRPEAERLLEEIDNTATPHQRRASIGDRLADIGDPRPGVGLNSDGLPEFVWLPVPGGEITLEGDAGTFTVQPFAISKYPITWAQYCSFLESKDGYRQQRWWQGLAVRKAQPGEQYRQQDNYPAKKVSWYDAVAFCRWLSACLGYDIRLPTEWEWQQAATGDDSAREYPWGVDWDPAYANTWESHLGRTTAVGVYPQGASPVGALDMSGNVEEWCLNECDYSQLYRSVRHGPLGDAWRVLWPLPRPRANVLSQRPRALRSPRRSGPAGGTVVPRSDLKSVHCRPR
jgi:formylglycine-generating enzyme required for sulfatase activity